MNRPFMQKSSEQGQAMVEFAILMIVFIPLLVWSMYFMDVGHHMLDLQETVLSTTWDYTGRTNQGIDSSSNTQTLQSVFHANRFEYIDHTSAYDDYAHIKNTASETSAGTADSDEQKYHYEYGAKAAWVGKSGSGADIVPISNFSSDYASNSARQVVCANDHDADLDWLNAGVGSLGGANPPYHFGQIEDFNKAGLMTCWAKLYVYNYVVPEKFMQEHAHVDLSKSKFETRSTDVETLSNAAKPLILRDHAAISFGTWAINDGEKGYMPQSAVGDKRGDIDYCPDSDNPFYVRVAFVYSGGGDSPSYGLSADAIGLVYKGMVQTTGAAFMAKGLSQKVERINAVPVWPGKTDGSPEGISPFGMACGTESAIQAVAGQPANIIGVNLVARHDRSNGESGEKAPITADGANLWRAAFESTPFEQGGGTFKNAWQSRGHHYMGNKTAEQ